MCVEGGPVDRGEFKPYSQYRGLRATKRNSKFIFILGWPVYFRDLALAMKVNGTLNFLVERRFRLCYS